MNKSLNRVQFLCETKDFASSLNKNCDEPSWSDIADAREDINNVVTELGYKLKWQ